MVVSRANPRRLLDEIEAGALDDSTDLSSVLRKCITLGGATGSERLRDWASLELKGYGGDDKLPEYRRVVAPLLLDGQAGNNWVTGQTVPLTMIPDFARDKIGNEVLFAQPIAEIEHLLRNARRDSTGIVRLSPPGTQELVALINNELVKDDRRQYLGSSLPPAQIVERVYWGVSLAPIARILDVVRTTLVELVAEMRSATPGGSAPSHEAAEQAVDIALYGKRNRIIVQQVASGGPATVAGGSISDPQLETPGRRIAWWIFGVAGIIAAVAAVWVLFL